MTVASAWVSFTACAMGQPCDAISHRAWDFTKSGEFYLLHTIEHRKSKVSGSTLTRGNTTDHVGAVVNGFFAVESTLEVSRRGRCV